MAQFHKHIAVFDDNITSAESLIQDNAIGNAISQMVCDYGPGRSGSRGHAVFHSIAQKTYWKAFQ